jgi:tRNA(Ile)-lysidine synthetase-like protein
MRGARPQLALERDVAERVNARPGELLVAAVSGGADSAALAALLAEAARDREARVLIAHVNHATRESAWQDEAVVLAIASALDVPAAVRQAAPGPPAEARLREERYRLLSAVARERGATRIFTAHHAGDQTETVLLALFRGTGPAGAAGMPERRELGGGLTLERPLLRASKASLAAYGAARRLPYAVDPTNADPGYRRNAVRLALEQVRPAFPGLDEAVARFAAILAESEGERGKLRDTLRNEIAGSADVKNVTFERLDAAARAIERGDRGRIFLAPGIEIELTGGRVFPAETSKSIAPHLSPSPEGLSDAASGRE